MGERWRRELDPVTKKRLEAEREMGRDIRNRMLAMGMRSPPGALTAYLPEIYTMRGQLGELIDQFVSADARDSRANGRVLVGLRVGILMHAGFMLRVAVRERAFEKVIAFCHATPRTSHIPPRRLGRRRAQEKSTMAQEITDKLLALGRRRPSTVLGERLSDLYVALEDNERVVDRFLRTDARDLKAMGKVLVDLKVALDAVLYLIREARRPLERAIDYCYGENTNTELS